MSDFGWILKDLNEALGGAADEYYQSNAILGTLIREGVEQGMSGRSILAAYRAAGGAVANSTFWQLRSQIATATNAFQNQAALWIEDPSLINKLPGGTKGLMRYDFRVYVRHASGEGLPDFTTTQFTVTGHDLSADDAIAKMGEISSSASDPSGPSGEFLGFELIGIGQYQGK